jgi:hypothetical protein
MFDEVMKWCIFFFVLLVFVQVLFADVFPAFGINPLALLLGKKPDSVTEKKSDESKKPDDSKIVSSSKKKLKKRIIEIYEDE